MNQVWHSSQAFYTREFSFDLAWTSSVLISKVAIANLPKLRFLEDCKTYVSAHSSSYQPVSIDNHYGVDSHADSCLEKKTCYSHMTSNHSKSSRWYRFLHLKRLLIPSSPTNGNNDASKVGSSWSFEVGTTKKATCHPEFADISWVALASACSCSCFLLLCSDILFFLVPSVFFNGW